MSKRGTIVSNEDFEKTTHWKTEIPFNTSLSELFFTSKSEGGTTLEDGMFDPTGLFKIQINDCVKLLINPNDDAMKSIKLSNFEVNKITIYGQGVSFYYYGVI
ncbi:hypothetical protein ACH0BF_02205 [Pseudobacillus sp. 179-B 2D1 NHS]|uniref:hypothetical protein n=1 Tax=Pseudobacillus sp. 179-B 2D1 NHS TaxID=3374292 RepID=UPI0038796220